MLYTDIPTSREFARLVDVRADKCISIYIPTHAVTSETDEDRILYKNAIRDALTQMRDADVDKRVVTAIEEELNGVQDDDELWQRLSDSLAVLATPDSVKTYRLPFSHRPRVEVSDRFHLKPLLAAITGSHSFFILSLSQGAVRLIQATPSNASELHIPHLTKDISHAIGRSMPKDPAPARRIQGGEGDKVLVKQFCRVVDRDIRPILAGRSEPLVLACVDYLAPIFRSVSSYAQITDEIVTGNPDPMTPEELRVAALPVVTTVSSVNDQAVRERFHQFQGSGKATDDLATIGRAVVGGLVDTLIIAKETPIYGTLDTASGAIGRAEAPGADSYDVIDKAASLTLQFGGSVLPLDLGEMPTQAPVAAILRYAI